MSIINTEKYLTTSQAATQLGLAVDTIKKYCQSGRIKAITIGRQWMISLAEVDKYNRDRREYTKNSE